jgi:iron(III) transport system ATP-binding protein
MADILVENLRLSYGSVEVLKGVSFSVEPGQVVALLGASGSGKTTLLRSVAGLEQPNEGRIVLGNTVLFDAEKSVALPPEKRGLGLVFQSYALWPHRTVEENVGYPLKLRKVPAAERRERVQKALESIGLGHLGSRYPHQLSGGQQQRVALARALVYEPRVILLDEPLSNLDAKLREEARIWLRRLITSLGLSALCVTHDQVEAMALADRVMLLNAGRVEQEGTPTEIYNHPKTLFAAEFMGANNRFSGTIRARTGNRAEIELEEVTIAGRPHEGLKTGDRATALVRLERTRWSREDGPGRLPVTLVHSVFLGDRYELVFTAHDQLVRAYSLDAVDQGKYFLEFAPDDVMIYPSGQEQLERT